MASTLEETSVTYEELSDLEAEFDEVETEISKFARPPTADVISPGIRWELPTSPT
jgi:hypothetical protein